jgi:hypothetical protein
LGAESKEKLDYEGRLSGFIIWDADRGRNHSTASKAFLAVPSVWQFVSLDTQRFTS